ncbi:MAG: hypothetical protein Q4C99_04825 [Clostridia bacterium]|nr:hypothetical protein [Clostridia bacterium]
MKKLLSILLSVVMIFSAVVPFTALAETAKITTAEATAVQSSVNSDIKGAINFLKNEKDYYGQLVTRQTIENSYTVHTIAKAGGDVSTYLTALDENLKANNGKIMARQQNETADSENLVYYAVAIDILTIAGKDVTNYNGYNLKETFENFAKTNQTVSNPYFYRCIIEACVNIKNNVLGLAFAKQMAQSYTIGSGFDYYGYSCDNTAMFVASVAPYKLALSEKVNDALKLIEKYKKEKGYYSEDKYTKYENADSTAYVIMAYSAVGEYDYAYNAYKLLVSNFESKTNDGVFLALDWNTGALAENAYATTDVLRALPYFDATQIYHNFNTSGVCTVCGSKKTASASENVPKPATTPAKPATSQTTTSSTKPAKTKVQKISAGKKSITAQWKKISGVSAYQVQIATNSKFTKNKKTFKVSKKSTKVKIKKLKAKKVYYVRVRSYKTKNGKKVYSKWSTVRKVKTK